MQLFVKGGTYEEHIHSEWIHKFEQYSIESLQDIQNLLWNNYFWYTKLPITLLIQLLLMKSIGSFYQVCNNISLTFELWSFDQYLHIVLHSFEQKFKKSYQVWFVKWKHNTTHTHTHTNNVVFFKFNTIKHMYLLQAYNWCLNLQPWQLIIKVSLYLQYMNLYTLLATN
jgi:hypothetical protein